MRFPTTFREWLLPASRPASQEPRLHHFRREADGRYIRYHLRIDPHGPAILIAGAADALLLSPAGAIVAEAILAGDSPNSVRHRLEISNPDELIGQVQQALASLGRDSDHYPILNLVDPAVVGQRLALVAPFQADVLVTDTSHLIPILDRLWAAGIPHVRLLLHTSRVGSGEIGHREIGHREIGHREIGHREIGHREIVAAVNHAEDIGMIAGVRARAGQLADSSALVELAEAGLDYVVMPWGVTPDCHAQVFGADDYEHLPSVVDEIVRWEMTPVFDAALTPGVEDHFESALDVVEDWDVHNVEVFAIADANRSSFEATSPCYAPQSLRQVASWIEEIADRRRQQLIWLPTVGRANEETWENIVQRGPRAGGDVTIQVLANGDVIPPRGPFRRAGNLLTDCWQSIWQDSAFDNYRERVELPTHCDQCPILAICAADCPAEPRSWATGDADTERLNCQKKRDD